MKKSFYLMTMVIAALVLNACSAIDNPVTPDKQSGGGVITINTAALYEELDIYDDMGKLNENSYFITDTVLIYNEKGRLVKKIGSLAQEMNTQTIAVDNLPNGTYTLVAWQSNFRVYDDGVVVTPFELSDVEKLAEVRLLKKNDRAIGYRFAAGIANATVTVDGNAFAVTLTPKAIGSIVDMTTEKPCEEYGYEATALYLAGQYTSGIYLDPSRTEADRWIVTEDSPWWDNMAYLEKDEYAYKYFTLPVYAKSQFVLAGWYSEEDQDQYDMLTDYANQKLQPGNNIYYFDMDRLNYQPPFLGSLEDFAIWKADRDAGKLVFDPYIKWGASYDDVKEHIAAKQWWAYSSTEDLSYDENFGWIVDIFVSNNMYESYAFETEDGKNLNMVYVGYLYEDDITQEDLIKTLLLQGYTYLGQAYDPDVETDADYYVSADGETMVETRKFPDSDIRFDALFFPFSEEIFENIGTPTATSRSIVPSKPHRTAAPTKARSIDRKFAVKKPTATVR